MHRMPQNSPLLSNAPISPRSIPLGSPRTPSKGSPSSAGLMPNSPPPLSLPPIMTAIEQSQQGRVQPRQLSDAGLGTNGVLDLSHSLDTKSRLNPNSLTASARVPGQSAMSEALNPPGGQRPGLIRRLSRGAANRLSIRRNNSANDVDESHGPIRRLRSNSGADAEPAPAAVIQADLESDDLDDVADGSLEGTRDICAKCANPTDDVEHKCANAALGPFVPMILQTGTPMTRLTKKKRVQGFFVLDMNSAKVTWDPSKPSARFYVDDVKSIRKGDEARNYREEFGISSEYEDRWITVIYGSRVDNGKTKVLHMIAPTTEIFKQWTTTLEKLLAYRTQTMAGLNIQGEKFVSTHWRREISKRVARNVQKEEKLSYEEVETLCRRLHVNCSKKFLRNRFDMADVDKSGYLDFGEFQEFVKILKERPEFQYIWKRAVASPDQGMTSEEFHTFLKDVQKVDMEAEKEFIPKIFNKFVRKSRAKSDPPALDDKDPRMSIVGFKEFLQSSIYNGPLLQSTAPILQQLDRPINEYFISSSHNTYFLGRQFVGEASIEAYIRVLQRGCRSVEVDCWDGPDGRPEVNHGRTLSTGISFLDVVTTIGKYAFTASPYPVTISLEVRCSLAQQVIMAEILINILGDKLVRTPLMSNTMGLPAPEDLKHKILIKVKGHEAFEGLSTDFTGISPPAKVPRGVAIPAGSNGAPPRIKDAKGVAVFSASSSNSTDESDSQQSPNSNSSDANRKRKPNKKIAKDLGELGVYCRGLKFANFALPESKTFNHIFSFSENTFQRVYKDEDKRAQLEKHNARYMMRVYPKYNRIRSDNFEPTRFWRSGVQMAALNWQTYDLGAQINEAMFASVSDHSGYVLKPLKLRTRKPDGTKDVKKLVKFCINIISAQQLPRSRRPEEALDPYIEVEIHTADDKAKGVAIATGGIDVGSSSGFVGLDAPIKRRTKAVKDNFFSPVWDEKMTFSLETKWEDLIFVKFVVYNDGGDRVPRATYCLKLASAAQGYRHVPLFDSDGEQYLFSSLFIKLDLEPVQQVPYAPIVPKAASALKTAVKNVFN